MDYSKLSTEDLLALKQGDYSKISNEGLLHLREQKALTKAEPSSAPKQESKGIFRQVMEPIRSAAIGTAEGTVGRLVDLKRTPEEDQVVKDNPVSYDIGHAAPQEAALMAATGPVIRAGGAVLEGLGGVGRFLTRGKVGTVIDGLERLLGRAAPAAKTEATVARELTPAQSGARNLWGPSSKEAPLAVEKSPTFIPRSAADPSRDPEILKLLESGGKSESVPLSRAISAEEKAQNKIINKNWDFPVRKKSLHGVE